MTTESVALIEEQVDSGLRDLLANYQPSHVPGGPQRDELAKRFAIRYGTQLPHLATAGAKACEASDNTNPARQAYALVLDNHFNYRHSAAEALAGLQHPHLVSILGHGSVFLTATNEAHQVIVLDKPMGKRLSEVLTQRRIAQEHVIRDSVLTPLSNALNFLREKRIIHGCINPDTIFVSDTLQLGECLSSPPGLAQKFLYEPPERMLASSYGKGQGDERVDVYALGVLTYEMLYGLEHLERFKPDELIRRFFELGVYNVFAARRDFPDGLQDFFRGIFTDHPSDRWGLDQLLQWVNGKRFNMITPSATHEAARPITFDSEEFYNPRTLSLRLHRNWRDAIKDMRQMKLDRWAEMSLHRVEVAERIARAMRTPDAQVTEAQNNDALSRSICALDPTGPIRTEHLSMRADGIGYALADAYFHDRTKDLQEFQEVITTDLPTYWADLNEWVKTQDFSQYLWKIQRTKPFWKINALGFGVERALYDLNPHLACQSPLLAAYHVTSLADLLRTLDTLAKKLAPDTSLVDKHIAAFIASKIDMGKQIRLLDLASIPELAENEELVMLKIFLKAQQKANLSLPGLCLWSAMRVERMLDHIHNRALRKKLKLQLKYCIAKGRLTDLVFLIVNRDLATRDYEGFAHAIALHQVNGQRIERLNNPKIIEKMSQHLGGRISATLGYTILSVTAYILLSKHLYF